MVLLTAVLTNYNHVKYLPEALDAMLSQNMDSYEILLIDDASTDNSLELIRSYEARFPQIRVIIHEKNQGPVGALNTGIRAARGIYVALCSADDVILPGFFKECTDLLNRFPEAALCTTNFCCFHDGETQKMSERGIPGVNEPCFLPPKQIASYIDKYDFWIPGNGSIFCREFMPKGELRQELRALCDWFFSLTMALRHGICYIPKPLASFRVVKNSYSAKSSQRELYDSLFHILENREFQDIKRFFLSSGVVFQLKKEIFSYLRHKPEYKKYYPLILFQKLKRKLFRNRYKRMLAPIDVYTQND